LLSLFSHRAAGVPVTDHSYEDCRLMGKAKSLGLPVESALVEYYKLSPMIGCVFSFINNFNSNT